ncbi:MAG: hypothetical protein IPK83_04945 [Planctomycetes bacterium]|nr:hypothetical protein [Planctomycetota bacterium]
MHRRNHFKPGTGGAFVALLSFFASLSSCDVAFPLIAPHGSQMLVSIDGRFVNMVSTELHAAWTKNGFADSDAIREITRQFYASFRDEAEFLVITTPDPLLGGSSLRVFNDVTGTGLARIDRRPEFGAKDSLAQIISLMGRNELTIRTAIHEIGHRWANRLKGDIALASPTTVAVGHWGFCDVNGPLGGFARDSLESLGNNLYRGAVAPAGYAVNTVSYAPLELYLMGLMPAEEVPDVTVAVNPVVTSQDFGTTTFQADELRVVSIDRIIEQNGPRVPAFRDAPNEFSIAFIVLTPGILSIQDQHFYSRAIDFLTRAEPITLMQVFKSVDELTPVKLEQDAFEAAGLNRFQNFQRATNGRGTLKLRYASDLRRLF